MLSVFFAAALSYFATLRLRTYLHAFQQEEYDNTRLLKWWYEKRAFDRYLTLGLLIGAPFAMLQPQATFLIAALWACYRIRQEPDPTVIGKKVLVLTARARSTWYLAALLVIVPLIAITMLGNPLLILAATVAMVQSLPLLLILANLIMAPLHGWQNRRYLRQARAILSRLHPATIGITGSFGKTSTKYILTHILNSHLPTLATPGSINTPLGIARVVREQLQPHHHYFVAEMGAYGPGSIARLCKLAPPQISAITAVGQAHYERFKSLETVATAKFEIAESTLQQGGRCILNADAIPDTLWQSRVAANPDSYRIVSTRKNIIRPGDYYISSTHQTSSGLTVNIEHNGQTTTLATPLFGSVQAGNVAVAFAVAAELGLAPATIAATLATVKAAPHRLNIQHNGSQTTIDDSYNANPAGFAGALETLTLIAHADVKLPRRRVLVTPGMVELGTMHDAEHARLGTLAATHADVILAIQPARIPSFTAAVRAAGHGNLHLLPSLAAARTWVQVNSLPGDVLLIANDLPDRYEANWNL